jgi:hypothetical protein
MKGHGSKFLAIAAFALVAGMVGYLGGPCWTCPVPSETSGDGF